MLSDYAFTLDETAPAIPIYIARPDSAGLIRDLLPDDLQSAARAREFTGRANERVLLRGADGALIGVLCGAGEAGQDYFGPMQVGSIARALPAGDYRIAVRPEEWEWPLMGLAWGLGVYRFTRYIQEPYEPAGLVLTENFNPAETVALVNSIAKGRDLINTPAGDMGPVQLHKETAQIAKRHGAVITETIGQALLDENLPMIHAVGRAGHEAPRLIEFMWGEEGDPKLTLVGKGITFDTGGLNIKSAAGARIMKKDMGGAAHALTLADMIMANNLPVRLHVMISIAENAISAGAYRPGDILPSRAGLTVEIDNTDAEGRLVLGDALTKGSERSPDLMIDFATLTGAARVALGPTLPPFFTNQRAYVQPVLDHADAQFDPVWSMPLWQPYHSYLSSPIADMKNAGGSFAGSVTAALFLERFIGDTPWMHFDVYGWNPSKTKFGRAGGEIFAVRALYEWIKSGGIARRSDGIL